MKFKRGDIVLIYRKYQKHTRWNDDGMMNDWLGKLAVITKSGNTIDGIQKYIHLKPLYWIPKHRYFGETNNSWVWDETMLKKLTKEEALAEVL